jgi:hypothetical protein
MDDITLALGSIECDLRTVGIPTVDDGTSFAIFNTESGENCGVPAGLTLEESLAEVKRMNREYDAMLLLVKAYVEGEISSYAVRATGASAAATSER